MAIKPITQCPHCGSAEGIFTKHSLIRIPWRCGFMGEEQDNGEMYDNAEVNIQGRMAYCQKCSKAICRLSTIQKQWEDW